MPPQIPRTLGAYGVMATAAPTSGIVAGGMEIAAACVAITNDGRVLLHHPGGMLASAKTIDLALAPEHIEDAAGTLTITNAHVRDLVLELDPRSSFHRVLKSIAEKKTGRLPARKRLDGRAPRGRRAAVARSGQRPARGSRAL
jgi:hypothetical protein